MKGRILAESAEWGFRSGRGNGRISTAILHTEQSWRAEGEAEKKRDFMMATAARSIHTRLTETGRRARKKKSEHCQEKTGFTKRE